ncbi:DUF4118 domain-containing protein [Alicyclobacillus dauci]|uniref:histidine kinase n=1 Tax=Alicyclobacillus dauci TaxID=1475485 RepID=A0ABY6Z820_9BACL|nr:DUF4118 domain-containing protein [Alicyclobacillus dauci]WAH38673.1 DUF4118 domain-containing protein [Alicyclobacillus dauci]
MSERERSELEIEAKLDTGPVLVCIGTSPFTENMIRMAQRMADRLKTGWFALFVDNARTVPTTEEDVNRLSFHMQLAQQLGGEVVSVTGERIGETIIEFARSKHVRHIIIGKPEESRLTNWLRHSIIQQLLNQSDGMVIHVIPGRMDITESIVHDMPGVRHRWHAYVLVTVFVCLLTVLLHQFNVSRDLVNIALIYLLPVLVSAVRWGLGPAFYASAIGVVAFDFFFVPPTHSFTVADLRYLVSFAVFLGVATLTASLASRLRTQLHFAKQREANTAALYALSRQMTAVSGLENVLQSIVKQVSTTIGHEVVIFLGDNLRDLHLAVSSRENIQDSEIQGDYGVARWVYSHGEIAGHGTRNLRQSPDLYLPLKTDTKIHGVLGIRMARGLTPDKLRLLEALAGLSAMALSRIKLEEEAKVAHLTAESERLRTALLDSISHELRTPLAAIIGSVTGLIETGEVLSTEDRQELLYNILDGAMRMNRLITNLLGMVRLESGMLRLNKNWCDIQDIVGVALNQFRETSGHRIVVKFSDDIPPVPLDDVLMEQVLVNLLSNAIKYSPVGSEITLSVTFDGDKLVIRVADEGFGIPAGEHDKVFDKFYRVQSGLKVPGTGLGLAICKGIVEAHGGTITAAPNSPRGTVFTVAMPVDSGSQF